MRPHLLTALSAAAASASVSAAPAAPRALQLAQVSGWGFFGLIIDPGSGLVLMTQGTMGFLIAGPALMLSLLVGFLCWRFARSPAKQATAMASDTAPVALPVENPLLAQQQQQRYRVNARDEAAAHWKGGAGELPPGWDWEGGENGRPVCYVRLSGGAPVLLAPTPTLPRHTAHTQRARFPPRAGGARWTAHLCGPARVL